MEGTITSLKLGKGFGFLTPHGGSQQIFFHADDLAPPLSFDGRLLERRVLFDLVETDKGQRAVALRPLE